jgi:hypothetical protein
VPRPSQPLQGFVVLSWGSPPHIRATRRGSGGRATGVGSCRLRQSSAPDYAVGRPSWHFVAVPVNSARLPEGA